MDTADCAVSATLPLGQAFNAGVLYQVARKGYERARTAASDDRAFDQLDALVAVVFSAAALEAFINEVASCADLRRGAPEPHVVGDFADLARLLEESRASPASKFRLASIVFGEGRGYPSGEHLWEEFLLLLSARDALVHLKDDVVHIDTGSGALLPPRKVVQQLQRRKLTPQLPDGSGASLTIWLSTPAVARWACNTATSMVRAVLEMLPSTGSEQNLRGILCDYSDAFVMVE
jgi:hypothetical protein